MKEIKDILPFLLLMICTSSLAQESGVERLKSFLCNIHHDGFLFGHHDDTLYGIGWEGENGRSDVKSVCGQYPAMMSFDLGHIELGKEKSLDNVSFSRIRQEIINQDKRGGISTLSWHLDNPLTGKDSWDVTGKEVVKSILPGGTRHQQFTIWLKRLCSFINSLKDEKGEKIPVIFRPWHEHTGSWFWWGKELCTVQEYKGLWKMIYQALKDNGVDNVLLAYSPGSEPKDCEEYFERYPGDGIIDILGLDIYQYDKEGYKKGLDSSLAILEKAGKEHNKIIALTETGVEAIPEPEWWTNTLLPLVSKYPIAYMVVWRNARERQNHYYAPYPGQISEQDFVKFFNDKRTLFINDINKKK